MGRGGALEFVSIGGFHSFLMLFLIEHGVWLCFMPVTRLTCLTSSQEQDSSPHGVRIVNSHCDFAAILVSCRLSLVHATIEGLRTVNGIFTSASYGE